MLDPSAHLLCNGIPRLDRSNKYQAYYHMQSCNRASLHNYTYLWCLSGLNIYCLHKGGWVHPWMGKLLRRSSQDDRTYIPDLVRGQGFLVQQVQFLGVYAELSQQMQRLAYSQD